MYQKSTMYYVLNKVYALTDHVHLITQLYGMYDWPWKNGHYLQNLFTDSYILCTAPLMTFQHDT